MKTFNLHNITTGLTLALCMLIAIPADAQPQRRDNRRTEQRRTDNNRADRRPGTGNNRDNNRNRNRNNNRADNKKKDNKNKQQPGYKRPDNRHKPGAGNRPDRNVKPDKKKPGGYGHSGRPGHAGRPEKPRMNRPRWNGYMAPPARPHRPHHRPMPHVTPPPHWRPYHNAPVINGILGLTFGTLYSATLDYLYSQNYAIDGYTSDIVYLRDVLQYGYIWDDVMLNYNANRLNSAQFVYSNGYRDTARYNNVYRTLCGTYGSPISMRVLSGGGYECAWYGGNTQGIVSLEYYPEGGRYYTILSFGAN